MEGKKIDIWSLVGISVAFVVITIVISFGAQILAQMQTGFTPTSTAYTNESVNFVANNTYYTLAHKGSSSPACVTPSLVTNDSQAVTSDNYGVDVTQATGCRIKIITGTNGIDTGTYKVTYHTLSDTQAYNISAYGLTSLNTFGTWLPTLALVVIASVIIGIIIGYLVVRLFRQGGVTGM